MASTTKRRVYSGVLLLLVVVGCELLVRLVLTCLPASSPWNAARMREDRSHLAEVGAGPGETAAKPMTKEEVAGNPDLLRDVYKTGLVALHPYLGLVPNPQRIEGISDLGFFGNPDPIQTRSPDRLIVAITGGSVASGFAVAGTPTMEVELRRHRPWRDREILFVNLAVPGYKQPQQLNALSYVLTLGGEFDVVVNLDGLNDVVLPLVENVAAGVFPLYPRAWQLLSKQGSDPEQLARIGQLAFLQDQRAARAGSAGRSGIGNALWRLRDQRLANRIYDLQRGLQNMKNETRDYKETGPLFEATSDDAVLDTLVNYWSRCSLQMHALANAFDFHYVHALQPNQYVSGSKPLSDEERKIAIDPNHPYRIPAEKGYPRLQKAATHLSEKGVHVLDLVDAFADHPETLYLDSCCHFNTRGQLILGSLIGQSIVESIERE